MATRYWNGSAGDGNWATAGNWTAAQPVTGDTVYILATAATGITTGLDRTGDTNGGNTGLNLVLFEVERGFAYDIGSTSSYLKLTADSFVDRGRGNTYFASATGTAAMVTDLVTIDKQSGGMDYLTSTAAITELRITGGAAEINPATLITNLYVAPRTESIGSTIISTVNNAGQGFDMIYMLGGELSLVNSTLEILHTSGSIIAGTTSAQSIGSASPVRNYVQTGGAFRFLRGSTGTFNIIGMTGFGGFFNGEEAPASSTPKTITTLLVGPGWSRTATHAGRFSISAETFLGD